MLCRTSSVAMFVSLTVLLVGFCLALSGCSSESTPAADSGTDGMSVVQSDSDIPLLDGGLVDGPPSLDGAVVQSCVCAADEVCGPNDQCIKSPKPLSGEVIAELRLLHQIRPPGTSLTSKLGKAEATFFVSETPPVDTRQAFPTIDKEQCYYEKNTTYPHFYEGRYWPEGPQLGAGQLTFDIMGAPGIVQLEPFKSTHSSGADTWGYFHKNVPPSLTDGTTTLSDMFDIAYVPLGSTFKVSLAGGPDLGAQALAKGRIPEAFSVSAPDIENGTGKISTSAPLTVQWTPAQPSARMEIFVMAQIGTKGDFALLSCDVTDDGLTVIPAAAMQKVASGTSIGVQLRRNTVNYLTTTAINGKLVHVRLIGRHARLRTFSREP